MNSNFCNLRPFSPINIQNNSSNHSHQCPHCKCSPSKYYYQTYPSSRPSININYASPSKNMTNLQPPLLYSPLISKPININVENNCYKNKVFAYNQNNIYYNRPTQVNISNGSSSNSSQQKFHLLKPQIRTSSPHQILVRQPHPVVFSRPTSPPIMRTDVNNRSIVRFISPPPVICHLKDVIPQNNSSTGEIQEILASKSSAFTFGQPKKPEILRMKKPGIKRLSSLNSQNSSNGQIKSPIKEQIQNQNRMANTYNYSRNTLQRCQISPKIQRPIQLKQKLSEKYISLLNKPKRYYSSSQGQTTTSNNTQMLNHTQTEYMTMDQVNTTYMKSTEHTNHLNHEVFNENRQEMQIENKNSHLYEQEHKIAEILVEELKLNYDYFNKNQITDRSISDHVQI